MRAVSKALGAILTAAALAAAARSRPSRRPRPAPRPRPRAPSARRQPVRASSTEPTAGRRPSPAQQPVPRARPLGPLRRLHRHGRELGPHRGVQDRQLPRLVGDQQRRRRTPTTPSTTSASAPASTGTWAAPASTRTGTAPRRRPTKWGAAQAADALAAMKKPQGDLPGGVGRHRAAGDRAGPRQRLEQRLLLALQRARDTEHSVPATVDRAEFNGFANYITSHSTYKVGVYSSAPVWTSIFGTGSAGEHPEHLRVDLPAGDLERSTSSTEPTGWCLHDSKTCAQFFGGQTSSSKYALMWQWSGGGGITNK